MPSFHDSYKPFRNYVRRFDLTSTLVDLWVYFRHLDDDAPLPPDYAVGARGLWHSSLKGQVFPLGPRHIDPRSSSQRRLGRRP
jgi:hypothetical protein